MSRLYKNYYYEGINQAVFGKLKKRHRGIILGFTAAVFILGMVF